MRSNSLVPPPSKPTYLCAISENTNACTHRNTIMGILPTAKFAKEEYNPRACSFRNTYPHNKNTTPKRYLTHIIAFVHDEHKL